MSKIYLSSDFHFCHDREFIYKPRGFNTIEEMNRAIIENWNNVVTEDDDGYILGDIMLKDNEVGAELLCQLHGRLHIVLGNHDTTTREQIYRESPNVVEVAEAIKIKYNKHHFFMCHYPTMTGNLEKEALTQMTLNLHGHTHSKEHFYNDIPYMYNVAVDAHRCKPVLIDKVIEEMYEKVKECKEML